MQSFIHADDHPCHHAEPKGNRLPKFASYWYCPVRGKQLNPTFDCSESCESYVPKGDADDMAARFPWSAPAQNYHADAPEGITILAYVALMDSEKLSINEMCRRTKIGYSTMHAKVRELRDEAERDDLTDETNAPEPQPAPKPVAPKPEPPVHIEPEAPVAPDPPQPFTPSPSVPAVPFPPAPSVPAVPVPAVTFPLPPYNQGCDQLCDLLDISLAPEVMAAFIADMGLADQAILYDRGYNAALRRVA